MQQLPVSDVRQTDGHGQCNKKQKSQKERNSLNRHSYTVHTQSSLVFETVNKNGGYKTILEHCCKLTVILNTQRVL